VGKKELEYLARNSPGSTYGRQKIVYRVRSGDVLGTIARKYHVRISDLKSWNRINGTLIHIGQRLNIWVLPTYTEKTKQLYTVDLPEAVKNEDKVVSGDGHIYKVRSGDSLWSISKENNTTIEKLKTANKLGTNTIKPGQSLLIPLK
jgi:membrane-bound lytic murein transglycosylase D